MRCVGSWKAMKHGHYCPIIITNEHNANQIGLFCYSKTSHPQKLATKKNKQYFRSINGISVCTNPGCVLGTKGEAHKDRNSLSALAIGLASLSIIFFGQSLPSSDPSFSEFKTEKFKTLAKAFSTRSIFGFASSPTEL
ncbi:unnamed protein product [Mucor circinelloides]